MSDRRTQSAARQRSNLRLLYQVALNQTRALRLRMLPSISLPLQTPRQRLHHQLHRHSPQMTLPRCCRSPVYCPFRESSRHTSCLSCRHARLQQIVAPCAQSFATVLTSTNLIARSRIAYRHKHHDLQRRIDTLTQMRPHDLASFISCFHYWITQRGFARYFGKRSADRPFVGWVILVSGHPAKSLKQQGMPRWQKVTKYLVELQEKISRSPATEHANILGETTQKIRHQSEGEYAEYKALCKLVAKQAVSQPFFDFKFFEMPETQEHLTYPATRLTQVTCLPQAMPRQVATPGQRQDLQVLDPCCPSGSVAQLALPPLPDARFCYYVEENEEWCRTVLSRQGPLSPLEKAAILDVVKIF